MPKLSQVSMTGGEVSPSLYARVDLARYATSLRTCRNFFVRATGGVSNRAGTQFVQALNPSSLATLIPFVFSTEQAYMLVFQQGDVQVFTGGAFVAEAGPVNITNIVDGPIGANNRRLFTTDEAHGMMAAQVVTITGVTGTGSYAVNGNWTILEIVSPTEFTVIGSGAPSGAYINGGQAAVLLNITTPYVSAELADLRYTQSFDVLTVAHQNHIPHEFIRTGASTFTFTDITDFEGGPFLDDNTTAITMTSSAATGTVTITASSSVFVAEHVGSLLRLTMNDVSSIPPWEPTKLLVAMGGNPNGLVRRSNGKAYICVTNEVAGTDGTYTGTDPPSHEEGIREDGDGNLIKDLATRSGVEWQYLHSLYGIVRITVAAGLTATATVLDYMPVVSPITTDAWAFGAWSEDQGYPALVTYYQDRLVAANTPEQPQTEWASKVGDYHNFGISSPLVANDSIRQTLNARQSNAIVELVPMDQLIALTSNSSWASPKRNEAWTPLTIGYDPQSFDGAAFLRAILTGDSAIFVQAGRTKVRDLAYKTDNDKFRGEELTILARHLFENGNTIVDLDYAKEPHGILWIVRSDGALIGLTYLKEQEVIGWHRHDTDGFFERVCVIPEEGRDVPYFVVRRSVNGSTVRYLERMAARDGGTILDSFFVDSGLTYDGRNTTSTTMSISGGSYEGGDIVLLSASSDVFEATDLQDVIQVGTVRAIITEFLDARNVHASLDSPVPVSLQGTFSTEWTFARNVFSGLSHLEGCTVAILADGSPEVPQEVVNGQITLTYPAGVVHVGLGYVGDVETLDLTIFGASESIRDRDKVVPSVAVVVEKTLGLLAGPNEGYLFDCGRQPVTFDYTQPWPLQDEVQVTTMTTNLDKNGRVLLRQANPLPATIVSIIPNVEIGGDG